MTHHTVTLSKAESAAIMWMANIGMVGASVPAGTMESCRRGLEKIIAARGETSYRRGGCVFSEGKSLRKR